MGPRQMKTGTVCNNTHKSQTLGKGRMWKDVKEKLNTAVKNKVFWSRDGLQMASPSDFPQISADQITAIIASVYKYLLFFIRKVEN